MATPKRRSARLATKPTSPLSPHRAFAAFAVNKLTSLLERDDSQTNLPPQSLDAALSSPIRGRNRMPGGFDEDDSVLKTPQTVPPPRPARDEMHPSKAQRSTTEEPDSALRLGFTDIRDNDTSTIRALDDTPSKSATELQNPGFEFKWAGAGAGRSNIADRILGNGDNGGDSNEISAETSRIMDSIRDEAARIKQRMQSEREEQARRDAEAGLVSPITGRVLATPRRKTGRFSDVHKQEFSKMESIASHASLLRDRAKPAGQQTLKRTKSHAELDEESVVDERPENPRAGKRMRTSVLGDVSSVAGAPKNITPKRVTASASKSTLRGPSFIPTAATTPTKASLARNTGLGTPTKASLARAASVKSLRTASKLPSMIRAKAARTLASPAPIGAKSEGSNKYFLALSRAPSMKSILHKAQHKYSNDPIKVAAGTHLPIEESTIEIGSPSNIQHPTPSRSPVKRVGFNLDNEVKSPNDVPSSPSKSPPGVHGENTPSKIKDPVVYPKLTPVRGGPLGSNPPDRSDFTFRSPQPIKFRSAPATPAAAKPSIRRVRPSGISTPLPPIDRLPAVPHGMPNKKRRRPDDDDDDDVENRTPGDHNGAKRAKTAVVTPKRFTPTVKDVKHMDAAEKRKDGISSASPKKKGFLSLSRLNALARPKHRA